MENMNFVPEQHKNSGFEDKNFFDPEFEKKMRLEGIVYREKIKPIESAEKNDDRMLVTYPDGEQELLEISKFDSLYKKDIFEDNKYVPQERKILALDTNNGEMTVFKLGENNDFTDERFVMNTNDLKKDYKKSLEQFRGIRGFDEAVVRIGTEEQEQALENLIQNPERFSREEFLDIIETNYSGEVYGNTHFALETAAWGGPDHGKLSKTLYGEFRHQYPELVSLSMDPGFMNHLPEFMELAKETDFSGMNAKEARDMLSQKLGTVEVYRGMTLTKEQADALKEHGVMSALGRGLNTLNHQIDFLESNVIAVEPRDMLEHHFYGNAYRSTFVSVSQNQDLAAELGERFGKNRDEGKVYVVKMVIPKIELVYQEHGHKVNKEDESFVFWKVNPEEIVDIQEVKG